MQTDIEIARQARLQPIQTIADRLGIPAEAVSPYGRFIGKVELDHIAALSHYQFILTRFCLTNYWRLQNTNLFD